MNNYNTETYEKLLEDVEDFIIGKNESVTTLFRVRDALRGIISLHKSTAFKQGDIVTDGTYTLMLLKLEPEYNVIIAYSALKNNVLLISKDDLVHYHKIGHMCPIKMTIHNEEESES